MSVVLIKNDDDDDDVGVNTFHEQLENNLYSCVPSLHYDRFNFFF